MKEFVLQHWAAITFGVLYFFTAAVSALPKPGDDRPFWSEFYDWLYVTLHILSNRAIERNPKLAPVAPKEVKSEL